ncbi:MAG TPA: late competence development ComFB family protein [Negativicutes bacterium]|nr:late competence development ComFB family protein [Negativicutes bacterium]
MELQNYMEILMWQRLDDVLDSHPGICRCEKCRYDIAALAMNFLPPRYVVTDRGQIYTKIKALEQQFTIDIVSAITHAIKIVNSTPRHQEPPKEA